LLASSLRGWFQPVEALFKQGELQAVNHEEEGTLANCFHPDVDLAVV
jgi:hypothetical protein